MATKNQSLAASPHHSCWVSASAGTGKTKILTDRLLRLLLQGTAPHNILCLTFTKAAATEMSTRLMHALGRWSLMQDAPLRKELSDLTGTPPTDEALSTARKLFATLTDKVESIHIHTIHAFCQFILQQFPMEAGVSPDATIMDSYRSAKLLDEASKALFQPTYLHDHPELTEAIDALLKHMSLHNIMSVIEHITLKRTHFERLLANYESPEAQASCLDALLHLPPRLTLEAHMKALTDTAIREKETITHAITILETGGKTDQKRAAYFASFLADPKTRYKDYCSIFLTQQGTPAKALLTATLAKKHPDILSFLEAEQARILVWEERFRALDTKERTLHLLMLAAHLLQHYSALKERYRLLDYHDLIHHTKSLLTDHAMAPWVLFKLDGGVEHILVDEAQDTSPEQWEIIKTIAEGFFTSQDDDSTLSTLFVVGDEKQSIYRFQGADPTEFRKMESFFSTLATEQQKPFSSITLETSFRSTPAVLALVDHLCANPQIHSAITSLTETIQHAPFRQNDYGSITLWPLLTPPKDEEETEESHPSHPMKQLAEKIVNQIADWFEEKRMLHGKGRRIEARDILILVRHRNDLMIYLIAMLKRRNLPVAGADRSLITSHIAVQDLMALTSFLLCTDDDLSLANVLKSPLCGWNDEQLFALTQTGEGDKSLWQKLFRLSEASPLHHDTVDYLSSLLKRTDFVTPFEFFSYLLHTHQGRKRFLARMGSEVSDVLDEFLSLTLSYQEQEAPSLQGFLAWLENHSQEIVKDLDHSSNMIRIMTVHGSKGLQAPIVIMPDTAHPPRSYDPFLWHQDSSMVLWPASTQRLDPRTDAYLNSLKQEDEKEYLRLLYVALTRAEDHLLICGWHQQQQAPSQSWYHYLQEAMSALGTKTEDGMTYALGEKALPAPGQERVAQTPPTLPDYFFSTPAKERGKSYGTATTSHYYDAPPSPLFKAADKTHRGTLIHELLQILPDAPALYRKSTAHKWIEHHAKGFSKKEAETIIHDTIHLIEHPEYQELFGPHSRAEVPIIGNLNGTTISGQIDRLITTKRHITIVDFKTHKNPPITLAAIPEDITLQLWYYRALLKKIYPKIPVRCAILWTSTPFLMHIPEEIFNKKDMALSDAI